MNPLWKTLGGEQGNSLLQRTPVTGGYLYRTYENLSPGGWQTTSMTFVPTARRDPPKK